jgi:alpha-tubulin suppressor-like RCC1 family protein
MSIWRVVRYRIRAAARIVLAVGVAAVAVGVAGPAQARPVLKLPPRSAAVSWGDNEHGQLGNGSTAPRATYAGVSGLSSGVAQVAAGLYDNCVALTTGGTVWTWGDAIALGTGSTADSAVPVQVPGLADITQVSAGLGFDLALRSDGTVWAWGLNVFGQLGDANTTGNTPVQVTGLTGVTQIAAGNGFSLALRSDGTVWAWGWNTHGQLGNGTTTDSDTPVQVTGLTNVIQIAAGTSTAMAVRVQIRQIGSIKVSVRTVWIWGDNNAGQLGDGTNTERTAPELVSGINVPTVVAIADGGNFSLVLGSDGSVWGWGLNSEGQLGYSTTDPEPRPVEILVGPEIAIAAGDAHALVLSRGGTVLAWGYDLFGTGTSSLEPVLVPGLAGVTQVSAGDDYSVAVHQVAAVSLPGGVPGTLRR